MRSRTRGILPGLAGWLILAVLLPPVASAGIPRAPVLSRSLVPGHPVALRFGEGLGDWTGFYLDVLPVTVACGILAWTAAAGIAAAVPQRMVSVTVGAVVFPAAILWLAAPLMAIVDPDAPLWPGEYLSVAALVVLLVCQLLAGLTVAWTLAPAGTVPVEPSPSEETA
ncbi:hypothetical protein Afil01_36010 [Actinorhabdospora filicis]|uniref:Uncharacterized protein n=1 Tax=Actinorhabdospora filicis TaxID=1785913 RepID=A0A9W6SKR1_9ACTN|nr:hypothetical protein [Actinorhabdospora filicis]GLZ78794.1 hypothetical protein Afil01_36010 [Actinorhabdospora filicis]